MQLHSVLDVMVASSFCCGQSIFKALVVLLRLCSLHVVTGPHCWRQQKDSLPSIFLACKRFQKWGFLKYDFFRISSTEKRLGNTAVRCFGLAGC